MIFRMMSVDPGYNAMGWALWDRVLVNKYELNACGVIVSSKTEKVFNSFDRVNDMIDQWQNTFCYMRPDILVCEEVTVMDGPGGYAAARTSLMGLAGAVGQWATWIHLNRGKFVPAPVVKWKGQLPKVAVNKRIRSILRPKEVKLLSKPASHDWDAVGIGLWYQGRF
jgi:Holliday junction resolvasome RuvABC endonuclease subunit